MTDDRLAHLEAKLNQRVKTTGYSKAKFLLQYRYLSIALAIVAAINTLSVAMSKFGDPPNENYLIIALVMSALLTLITAWQASVNPKDKFAKNADALNEVVDIRERLEWRKIDTKTPLTDEELDKIFIKFRVIEKAFFGSLAKTNIQDAE